MITENKMKKTIHRIKKSASDKYKLVLRFVWANSTAATVILILTIISGAAYSVVASTSSSKDHHSESSKLQSLDESKLNEFTDSTASNSKSGQKSKNADHTTDTGTHQTRDDQASQSSSSENTKTSDTTRPSTSPASPSPAKPATCPYQAFDAHLGPLTRSNGTDTISYTATYTISPTCAAFGNPNVTITITANRYYSPCINMADRNNGIISMTRRYDGNNTFSITCIVQRVLLTNPSVPRYVAPLPSASRFYLGISATLGNGDIVIGSGETCYLESGFDRY